MKISLALLVPATALSVAPLAAQVAGPVVTEIRIGHDAVSFYAQEAPYIPTEWRVARFARATGTWIAGDSATRQARVYVPQRTGAVVHLVRELGLVGGRPLRPGVGFLNYLVVSNTGERYPLHASLSERERWALLFAGDSAAILWRQDPPPLCDRPSQWVTDSHAIWFACTEGGALSAILRFDRRTHQTTAITSAGPASMSLVGLAETRRAVWVAGKPDTPSGLVDRGLFRFDLATRAWERIARQPTAIAASGDSLWVASDEGIAVYDEEKKVWHEWSFHARTTIDTTDDDRGVESITVHERFDLVPGNPPANEARDRLRIVLASRLLEDPWVVSVGGDLSADSVLALIRALPNAHLDSALADPDLMIEHALADPSLIRLATRQWFAVDSSVEMWDADVSRAIAILGDRRFLPVLQRVWPRDAAANDGVWLATALTQLGDTTGIAWLHETVARTSDWSSLEAAAAALNDLHDGTAAALIAARLDQLRDSDATAAALTLHALLMVATPAQWRATVQHLAQTPLLRGALLDRFYAWPLDSIVRSDSAIRDAAIGIAHQELTKEGSTAHWAAADLLVLCRDPDAVAYLLPMVTRSPDDYRIAQATLIQLSGIDSAPTWTHPTAAERAQSRRFWEAWWHSQSSSFVPVSAAAGKSAFVRSRLRVLGVIRPG